MKGNTPYGLLAVGGGGRPPPAADPTAAEAWWRGASFGHWRPAAVVLPPVMLAEEPARWCGAGGMGPGPRNAAALVQAALLTLPAGTWCPEAVVLVVAGPVAPHTWRIANGGVATAPGGWVRRYAALPADAGIGVWVHELAHLLLGWPDLPGSPCVMGAGAARDAGRNPAPPGAGLAHSAGWFRVRPAAPELIAADIGAGEAVTLEWYGRTLLLSRIERQISIHDAAKPGPPLGSTTITDLTAPLLASAASALRSLARV
jgi:hypothetical protein